MKATGILYKKGIFYIFIFRNIPATFLAPPGDVKDAWTPFDPLKVYNGEAEARTKITFDEFESSDFRKTILAAKKKLENEAHKLSVKAQTTLKRIKEFANISRSGLECQSAADCKTNQV